ncbi:MAG: hypothetical protein ACSLFI_12280 [Solirubrobacterales bacterium]
MIISMFIRRLKEGATFEDFQREWAAEKGFGVPTRVINAPSLQDPRDIVSIGFIDVSLEQFEAAMAHPQSSEAERHEKIDTAIESTTLRCQYEVKGEFDITDVPVEIGQGSAESLFAAMAGH